MDFKKVSKKMLSIMLALVMALPMVAITPLTVGASVEPFFFGDIADFALTGVDRDLFARGRQSMSLNGLSATATAVNVAARTVTVSVSGSNPVALPNARYIVYARAGGGERTQNQAPNVTVDAGLITNFYYFTHDALPGAPITLTFPGAGALEYIRVYIGIVTDRGLVESTDDNAIANILTINGVSVNADFTRGDGIVTPSVLSYTLSGSAQRAGTLRVWFADDSAAWGGVTTTNTAERPIGQAPQTVSAFNLDRGATATGGTGSFNVMPAVVPVSTVIRAEFDPFIGDAVDIDADFFYTINHAAETITFGQAFNVWSLPVLQPNGRVYAPRNADGIRRPVPRAAADINTYITVQRSEISVIFNRRPDNIRVDRGNWNRVNQVTGEVCIRRHLARGGWLGVRQTVRGVHTLVGLIEIAPRAAHRGYPGSLRDHRRSVYVTCLATVGPDGNLVSIREGGFLQNQHGSYPIEINIARGAFTAQGTIPAGGRQALDHDILPRGTRGTFRIAPQEADAFIMYGGSTWSIRDLWYAHNGTGTVTCEVNGDSFDLATVLNAGRFASANTRFNVPNQPAAPRGDRMVLTAGRNGAPTFISRTNARMFVYRPSADPDAPAASNWVRIAANATVGSIIALFDGHAMPVHPDGEQYSFEIRVIRNNRVLSAPGFVNVPRDDFHAGAVASAAITNPRAISGVQGTTLPNNATVDIRIQTSGTRTDVMNNTVVTDWFYPALPYGIVATTRGRASSGSVFIIRLSGGSDTVVENLPLSITIPADMLTDSATPLTVSHDYALFTLACNECRVAPCTCHTCTADNCGDVCTVDGCDLYFRCGLDTCADCDPGPSPLDVARGELYTAITYAEALRVDAHVLDYPAYEVDFGIIFWSTAAHVAFSNAIAEASVALASDDVDVVYGALIALAVAYEVFESAMQVGTLLP